MKIQKAELKYFKFHQDLTVNFEGKNLLIYGENGTGKSSIYEALYSNFYHQKRVDKGIDIQETYKNRNCPTENLEVNIKFDNNEDLKRSENVLSSLDVLKIDSFEPTIYFANEKVLNRLVKENFYIALKDTLVEHFPKCQALIDFYKYFDNLETFKKQIATEIKSEDSSQILDAFNNKIADANTNFETKFKELIVESEINKIIKEHFDESFTILFSITHAQSGNSDILKFNPPMIKINIDEIECNGKLSHHFNEAKLKLIGTAIYFALAKKYEASGNGFKLLVLDDFLTSLDMANRKLIMKYILEEFKDYQKLILTHNLQFFNITRKMIDLDSEDKEHWKIQKLFVYDNKASLYDKHLSYLSDASESLGRGDEHSAGNFLRKEFERITTEFEQLLELGRVEDLRYVLGALTSKDKHIVKANQDFNALVKTINNFMKSDKSSEDKLKSIQNIIEKRDSKEIDFNEEVDGKKINIKIKKAIFYKNIILNPTSHDDAQSEIYKKECDNAIKILTYLNKVIKNLKGTKYE